ncbi:molybdenum cofactor guanylyltransferase [Stenotrophomonas maltophilia]|uniref:molybdenum cofactor guanylyltransferase n=1 Tax=Stenotrophomonas maltophilia TaxID=40324 RepID=UPI003D18A01C
MAMTTSTAIDGIVLAGGLSSRMGRDKALLPWRGRTLLEHMRDVLIAAGAQRVWVSGDYPAFDGIPDQVARCGPLGGLYSVSLAMPDTVAWVVPVDMPSLTGALLHRLHGVPSACSVFSGEPLPMCLQIDDHCRRALRTLIEDPQARRSLRALQERLAATALPLPENERALLFNCNTGADWESIAT